MAKPTIPHTLAAAINEAKAPYHATRDDVHGLLKPVLSLVTKSQKQIAEHRSYLFAAQLEHPHTDGHTELLHQTLRAWEKDVQALMEAAQRVRLSFLQYERYAHAIEKEYTPVEETR
jgi:hypothetical protein